MKTRELTENTARQLIGEFREALRTGNVDKIVACFADDIVLEDVPQGSACHGKAEVRKYMEGWLGAFSNIEVSVPNWVLSGDCLIVEEVFKCTHTGPFLGYAPTGRQIELRGCEIMNVRDGLVYRDCLYYDLGTILRQISAKEERRAA